MIHFIKTCTFHLIILFLTSTTVIASVKVLVIPKGSKATFWKSLEEGAIQAGKDLGVSVTIRGPYTEDLHDAQIDIIDFGIKQNFDAIVLAPNHVDVTASALKRAVEKGIKVALIDSNMTSKYHATLIESDNYRAGEMAADHMASLLGNAGNVILARHIKGHSSTQEREQGFLDTVASRYPNIKIIADPYVGLSLGQAYHTMSDLLQQLPVINGIFSVGEQATLGILKALKKGNLQAKIKFIGFDFNPTIRTAILNHEIDGTIVQNPFQIGYQGVKIANQLIQNKKVPAQIHTDILLVNRENIHKPEVQEFVKLIMVPKK